MPVDTERAALTPRPGAPSSKVGRLLCRVVRQPSTQASGLRVRRALAAPVSPQTLHDLATAHSSERYCGGSAAVGRERQARRSFPPFLSLRQQSTAPCCATVRPCRASAASLTPLLHGLATVHSSERYCGGSCACRCATRGSIVCSGCRHRIGCDASTTTCPSGPACASRALSSSVRLCATGIVLRNSPTGGRRGCISRAAAEAITAQLRTTRGPGAPPHSNRCGVLTTAPRSCYSTYNERYCGGSSAALRRSGALF